jgi:site-specific recombinase
LGWFSNRKWLHSINQDKREIIKKLLKNVETWDIFSISVLYLHIIGNILKIFSLQGTFISKLFLELSKNIHPNPEKRYNLKTMREIYNKLFNEETDWKYINNLKNHKIFKLLENLQQ